MSARRVRRPLNEGRSINSGDTIAHYPQADGSVNSAQRRPEYKLRRHQMARPMVCASSGPLNEGRSINSGDTRPPTRPAAPTRRSLNEGRSINSGDTTPPASPCGHLRPLNEGRSINSGDTGVTMPMAAIGERRAQRRPEYKLRRHSDWVMARRPNGTLAQRRPEYKLRRHCRCMKLQNFSSRRAQRRPEYKLRRHPRNGRPTTRYVTIAQRRPEYKLRRHMVKDMARQKGRDLAQRRPEYKLRRHSCGPRTCRPAALPLNEGRSINSGDTNYGPIGWGALLARSTKAGV